MRFQRTIVHFFIAFQCTSLLCGEAPSALLDPVVTHKGTNVAGGLKKTITIHVEGLSAYLAKNSKTNPEYMLYLQGTPLPDLAVTPPTLGEDDLTFVLDRTEVNKSDWAILFRNPVSVRTIPLTVGLKGGPIFRTEVNDFQ